MKAKLGMPPIAWWNDDLPELSDDVSLEECLRQSRSAGFTGMEKGRRFPESAAEMLPVLKKADVRLCGGWFSGTLTIEDLATNKDRIQPMIELFKAVKAPCIVYGEVGLSIQGDRSKPLATKAKLSGDEIPERMKGMVDRVDTDKDGAISREEWDKAMQGGRRGGQGGQRPGRGETPKKEGETPKKDEEEGGF